MTPRSAKTTSAIRETVITKAVPPAASSASRCSLSIVCRREGEGEGAKATHGAQGGGTEGLLPGRPEEGPRGGGGARCGHL